jgi:heptosyltransferase-3
VKILVLKFKTIGDVLLVTPLIRNLRSNYPESIIDVAVNQGTEDMLTLNPNIDHIWIYDRIKIKNKPIIKKIKSEFDFLKNIRKQKYDMVIDLDRGDRGAGISLISGARIKIGSKYIKSRIVKNTYTHFLPEYEDKHVVDINLDAIRVLDGKINDKKVELFWSKDDQKLVDKILTNESFIHIHPFSRVSYKDIDSNSISKIIDYCELDLGINVVLTSAPIQREINKISKILELCKSKPTSLSGELTLKQVAALNKKAKLFIGVDTVIMHISAANSTPTLAFFGPTAANRWGPWDNKLQKSLYRRRGGIQKSGMNIVYSKNLSCIPCNRRGCNNDNLKSDCLSELDFNSIKTNIGIIIDEQDN